MLLKKDSIEELKHERRERRDAVSPGEDGTCKEEEARERVTRLVIHDSRKACPFHTTLDSSW